MCIARTVIPFFLLVLFIGCKKEAKEERSQNEKLPVGHKLKTSDQNDTEDTLKVIKPIVPKPKIDSLQKFENLIGTWWQFEDPIKCISTLFFADSKHFKKYSCHHKDTILGEYFLSGDTLYLDQKILLDTHHKKDKPDFFSRKKVSCVMKNDSILFIEERGYTPIGWTNPLPVFENPVFSRVPPPEKFGNLVNTRWQYEYRNECIETLFFMDDEKFWRYSCHELDTILGEYFLSGDTLLYLDQKILRDSYNNKAESEFFTRTKITCIMKNGSMAFVGERSHTGKNWSDESSVFDDPIYYQTE